MEGRRKDGKRKDQERRRDVREGIKKIDFINMKFNRHHMHHHMTTSHYPSHASSYDHITLPITCMFPSHDPRSHDHMTHLIPLLRDNAVYLILLTK